MYVCVCTCPFRLIRRLPMTTDAQTQHRHLADKVNGGNSKTTNDNPILRWQVRVV